jgi:NAD(P)-dependent dehydrogenase (short-subunit alcohol dehydrogenase family)
MTVKIDLSGRVMLITGASSGIGAHAAKAAAASGAKVVLAARRYDRLQQLANEITAEGGQALAVAMDSTDEASTIAAFDAAQAAFGTVNTIIANAGSGYRGRATDMPIDDFDQIMSINVRGVFLTVREGARRMIASGSEDRQDGRIVIVSSVTAVDTVSSTAVYGASKAASLHLGRNLALDWIRRGINVNVILPGFIHTDMNDALFGTEKGEQFVKQFPRKRVMQISDVLPMMLFLSSDAARAITGSAFTIDDGQML